MSTMQTVGKTPAKDDDRVMAALISGLECEFGRGAGEALARRFLDAEEVEFLWDARVRERWNGRWMRDVEDEDLELDRITILARLDRKWIVSTLIVDGDGHPHGLLARRDFGSRRTADRAFADAP